jgi:hypothetical protein
VSNPKDASVEVVIEALHYLQVNAVKNTSLLSEAYNLTLPPVMFQRQPLNWGLKIMRIRQLNQPLGVGIYLP